MDDLRVAVLGPLPSSNTGGVRHLSVDLHQLLHSFWGEDIIRGKDDRVEPNIIREVFPEPLMVS